MRVVITGATGNVGSALLRRLIVDPEIDEIVAFARRTPDLERAKVTWVSGDVRTYDLERLFTGASAVVNLVWRIQPSRDLDLTRSVDVAGTERVLDAVGAARVPTLVHASSVAAYGPGPDEPVDETWPTTGIPTSFYSREKVAAEALLDAFEATHSGVRVVRLRPAIIFQRDAAQEIRRYFLGPFWPSPLIRPGWMPIAPVPRAMRFQVVHANDIAEAYRLALLRPDAHGAYNVAAGPVITPRRLASLLGGLPLPIPQTVLRALASVTWKAHLQPSPPGWVDLGVQSPLMDTARIRALGWEPRHDGLETMRELLVGLRDRSGGATPPLRADAGGPLRIDELRSKVGDKVPGLDR